jgi:hypothetical protein
MKIATDMLLTCIIVHLFRDAQGYANHLISKRLIEPTYPMKLTPYIAGGVIMDVINAEQAKIAEAAGACAVMALERFVQT